MSESPLGTMPVAPDAVRVWRGFRLPSLDTDTFFDKLGSIFIPGTVQIQSPVGLTAYLPSVLPRDKPSAAPDEIAIVFYAYQDAYHEAKETVGGRAYSDLHGLVFDLSRSTSGFPIKYQGEIEPDMRYHLFDTHVDWQVGVVNTFVGVRGTRTVDAFLGAIGDRMTDIQSRGGPDGAIFVAADETLVYWEHWPDAASAAGSRLGELATLADPVYQQAMPSYPLAEGLWQPYDGVSVEGGESFNFRFRRRDEA